MTAALWARALVVSVAGAALLVAWSRRRRLQAHRTDADEAGMGPQPLDQGFPPEAARGRGWDPIGEQSEQSFPASDPPSWSGVIVGAARH